MNASKAIEDSVHRCFGSSLWSSLYFAASCGEAHLLIIKISIENQEMPGYLKLRGLIRWSAPEGSPPEALRRNWVRRQVTIQITDDLKIRFSSNFSRKKTSATYRKAHQPRFFLNGSSHNQGSSPLSGCPIEIGVATVRRREQPRWSWPAYSVPYRSRDDAARHSERAVRCVEPLKVRRGVLAVAWRGPDVCP